MPRPPTEHGSYCSVGSWWKSQCFCCITLARDCFCHFMRINERFPIIIFLLLILLLSFMFLLIFLLIDHNSFFCLFVLTPSFLHHHDSFFSLLSSFYFSSLPDSSSSSSSFLSSGLCLGCDGTWCLNSVMRKSEMVLAVRVMLCWWYNTRWWWWWWCNTHTALSADTKLQKKNITLQICGVCVYGWNRVCSVREQRFSVSLCCRKCSGCSGKENQVGPS